jgi:hypothetical protein
VMDNKLNALIDLGGGSTSLASVLREMPSNRGKTLGRRRRGCCW